MTVLEALKRTETFTPRHALHEALMLAGVPVTHGCVHQLAYCAGQPDDDEQEPAAFLVRLDRGAGFDALRKAMKMELDEAARHGEWT